MSPHSSFADYRLSNAVTLIDNCLVICFRKCELFACQTISKYANSSHWSSDVSDRAFSPEPSVQTPPSPCFSYSASETETLKNDASNGWSLFQSFVKENSECFWNPSLIASINSIEYRGYILPCNLLITGSEFDLQVIRSCWSQMTLKAPQGYAIESVGDMPTVEMTTVDQTHFTPLSEALCSCIHSLNVEGTAAFPHLIVDSLREKYPHLTPPSIDMIKAALKALQSEGKLRYISSRGFVVLPPETNYTIKRLTAGRNNHATHAPILMSTEQAIGKLHGVPGEAEVTFRSFGVQVDDAKLSSSGSSAVRPQYAIDCDLFNGGGKHRYANDSSLKRSASLRVYSSDKAKNGDEKGFSFMRSKSLKLQRERQTKSFGLETLTSTKSEKKPSMLSKLFTRLSSGGSQTKRSESVIDSTTTMNTTAVISSRDTDCKSTQTQTTSNNDSTGKKCAKSDTLKSHKMKTIAVNNGYNSVYNHYMPCTCSNGYIDQRQYASSCVDARCAYDSGGRFVCVTELDPNCRHCMACLTNSTTLCCNEFIGNGYAFEKQQMKQQAHRQLQQQHQQPQPQQQQQTGKAITASAARSWSSVDAMRPKTPLKLNNNNKSVNNEKTKPIAIQTNAIRENNTATASVMNDAKQRTECHLTSMDTIRNEHNGSQLDESINDAIVCRELCETVNKAENQFKRPQLDSGGVKKSNSDYKVTSAAANSVNVKIEIGSKVTAASQQPTDSLSSKNVSNDAISGSNLGQRLIAKCGDEPKLSMNAVKANDSKAKKANITSTTVTTTMTLPNVSLTADKHNFTVNTVTKTNDNTYKGEPILPFKYSETNKVLSLDQCTCKQKNLIVNALNADLKSKNEEFDEHHISSLSQIREKVAKAKAAFFSSNHANAQHTSS